ncbi:MAG: MFS transporter [Nitrososphaerales archaeon]|nr:MFS transporter [Nitrososphaerales archaeon]
MREPEPASGLPRWTILSVTTLSSFMVALDSNIVTIALPAMSKGLSSGVSLLGWVVTGYIIAAAALVLQAGKMGDNYGKKRVYLLGFAIFGFASALCGLSQSAVELVTFRVVQGIGASVLTATGLPLIFASFRPNERGSAIGVNSIAWGMGAVAGPLLGGILTQIDWRFIFYVNVPVAAAAILVAFRRIPAALDVRGGNASRLNLVNATLLGLAVTLVMLWLSFFDYRLVPAAILAAGLFVAAEARSGNPILNKELMRNRGFVYSVLALALMQIGFFGITFVMSFYFQSISGFSPVVAGLWISPLPVALAVFNPIGGRVFDRLRRSAVASIVGGLLAAGSVVVLSATMGSASPGLYVAALLGVVGVGGGLVWAPSIASALKFARQELRGVANGTAFTLIFIAYAVSVALVVSVSAASLPPTLVGQIYLGSVSGLTAPQAALFAGGLSKALLALAVVILASIPLYFLVMREQGRRFRPYAPTPAGSGAPETMTAPAGQG